MKKIIFISFFILSIINASDLKADTSDIENCILEQTQEVNIYFEGYKTNFKIGVTGKFRDVTYIKNPNNAKNISELLINYKIIIDKKSVYTAEEEISENLLKYFLNILDGDTIEATIIDLKPINFEEVNEDIKKKQSSRIKKAATKKYNYKKGDIVLEVSMNGIKKNIDMKYYTKKETIHGRGKLNLLDFNANDALSSLNKACFDKHLGKTWSDVGINFNIKTKKICEKKVER